MAQPGLQAWTPAQQPLHLVEQTVPPTDPDPKALACYGLRVPERTPQGVSQAHGWLRCVADRPVSARTGGNPAREPTGAIGAMLRGIKQRVLALANPEFPRPLGPIIVSGRAGHRQKAGERRPRFEQLGDGLAQTPIGFPRARRALVLQPRFEPRQEPYA